MEFQKVSYLCRLYFFFPQVYTLNILFIAIIYGEASPYLPHKNQILTLLQITCIKICVIWLVMVFWPCVWRTIYVCWPKRVNSVKYDCDDWLARLVASIQERMLARNSWKKNWLKNYFADIASKLVALKVNRLASCSDMYLRAVASERADHSDKRRHDEVKHDGEARWHQFMTTAHFEIHTVHNRQAWQQYFLICPHHSASYGGQVFW